MVALIFFLSCMAIAICFLIAFYVTEQQKMRYAEQGAAMLRLCSMNGDGHDVACDQCGLSLDEMSIAAISEDGDAWCRDCRPARAALAAQPAPGKEDC